MFGFLPFGGFGGWELLIILFMGLLFLAVVGAIFYIALKVGSGKTSSQEERIRCPECAEWIMAEANKCRFCGAKLDRDESY